VRKANESFAGFDLVSGEAVQLNTRRLKLITKRTRHQLPQIDNQIVKSHSVLNFQKPAHSTR
jgi:hypothetical protein